MKHQYFGDENDYRKYGVLRCLAGGGRLSVGVCWMLTPDDGRSDGRFTDYLRKPAHRRHDPPLYDALSSAMASGPRHLDHVSRLEVLPGARYYSAVVPDRSNDRSEYFRSAMAALEGVDLLFFDPDNGIEVASRPRGSRDSSKYIFWDEITAACSTGHSVLVYQHFPREARASYVSRMTAELQARTGVAAVLTFFTSRVLFLLAAQERHVEALRLGAKDVEHAWNGQISVRLYEPDGSIAPNESPPPQRKQSCSSA
jgi:hypothetical protein